MDFAGSSDISPLANGCGDELFERMESEFKQLRMIFLGQPGQERTVQFSPQTDVEAALNQPLILLNKLPQLPGVSILVSLANERALIVVDRRGKFLAEALLVTVRDGGNNELAVDLLAHDPAVEDWFDSLNDRLSVTEALDRLVPPFCVVTWKNAAADNLSVIEQGFLQKELARVVGGIAHELSH